MHHALVPHNRWNSENLRLAFYVRQIILYGIGRNGDIAMELIQAKIRCLPGVADTGWFKPGRGLSLLTSESPGLGSVILMGLEALNPLYDIEEADPFREHQRTWLQGNFTRTVITSKKTAVCTIFAADPHAVKQLATLDDSLFETDRIEFGRRLDYTRWVSFVEIPASGRWSEIREEMTALREVLASRTLLHDAPSTPFPDNVKNTDRLKGDLSQQCKRWLHSNSRHWQGDTKKLYNHCLERVGLHDRFTLACRYLDESLPPIIRTTATGKRPVRTPRDVLIELVTARYNLTTSSAAEKHHLKQRILHAGSSMPAIDTETTVENCCAALSLEDTVTNTSCRERDSIAELSQICLLTQLLWQRYPLLLLDGYDAGNETEQKNLFRFLEVLAGHTQVIFHASRHAPPLETAGHARLYVRKNGTVTDEGL